MTIVFKLTFKYQNEFNLERKLVDNRRWGKTSVKLEEGGFQKERAELQEQGGEIPETGKNGMVSTVPHCK